MGKKQGGFLIILSVIAVVISGYVSISQNSVLNLAGTQWMMIAIVLGIYGIYLNTKVSG